MANERDDKKLGEEKEFGQDRQPPAGQRSKQPIGQQGEQPLGQQGEQPLGQPGQQGEQPLGQPGQQAEFGQQGQSSSGQAEPGRSGETETLGTERGVGQGADGSGAASGGEGVGGFVGSQGTGSDEYLREEGPTGGSDFASQGQGALEGEDEDVETGQRRNRDSDIEGGSGNI